MARSHAARCFIYTTIALAALGGSAAMGLERIAPLLEDDPRPAVRSPDVGKLQDAIRDDKLDAVKTLLERSPGIINAVSVMPGESKPSFTDGYTPLHYAVEFRANPKMIEYLLEKGAAIDATTPGFAPLDIAVRHHEKATVALLLKHKADPNGAKAEGAMAPLHHALLQGDTDIAGMLVKAGATPDPYAKAALGDSKAIDAALEKDPALAAKGNDAGYTLLHFAVLSGDVNLVKRVAAAPAEANIDPAAKNGKTPLHLAAAAGTKEIVAYLLAKHADVTRTDYHGETPLYHAHTRAIADLLLDARSDPTVHDDSGWAPLHQAAADGNLALVESLIAHKADVNIPNTEGAPFPSAAADLGPPKVVKHNHTPLHTAASSGHLEVVEALLKAGADVNAVDEHGQKPLDYAREGKEAKVAELLKKHGGK